MKYVANTILIDGPRSAGKSRLAAAVVEALRERGHKAEVVKEEPARDWRSQIDRQLKHAEVHDDTIFVFDRFHLSELVYRWHDKKVDLLDVLTGVIDVDDELVELAALSYVVVANHAELARRTAARADGKVEDIPPREAVGLWDVAASVSLITEVIVNDTEQEFGENVTRIVGDIESANEVS